MTAKWTSELRRPRRIIYLSLLLLLGLTLTGQVHAAGDYVVTNTLDSGDGSLRWAIEQANSQPGPDVIRFHPNVTGKTILLASNLPALTDNGTTIDAGPNWVGSWPSGEPGIGLTKREFDSTADVGLHIQGADDCLIKGLRIEGLSTGIFISAGADPANRATGNTIGAGAPGGRMVIRNCSSDAVRIANSDYNRIIGCYIGVSKAGNLPEPNEGAGVHIDLGRFNEIGGTGPLEGNIIGASAHGVWIEGSFWVTTMGNNIVQANQIGTGMLDGDVGNRGYGVFISSTDHNEVGGVSSDAGNAISNNDYGGVALNVFSDFNSISGNDISDNEGPGVGITQSDNNSVNGNNITGNDTHGLAIASANGNTVQGNTIVRNTQSGVYLWEEVRTYQNQILSNFIGVDAAGTAGLGNGQFGVLLHDGARSTTVEGNVIAQNGSSGVALLSDNTTANLIHKNYIGLTKTGQPLGNGYDGVLVSLSPANTIRQNIIAYNGTTTSRAGVRVEAATATGNAIWSNSIYSNSGAGIELLYSGNNNLAAPTLSQAECGHVSGDGAPANGLVQIFSDEADEGRHYEGEVSADGSGRWVYHGPFRGPYLTATATDAANNTSPFSAPVAAEGCRPIYLPVIRR